MLEVTEQEVVERLKFDNPWWDQGVVSLGRFSNMPRRLYFAPFFSLVQTQNPNRAVVMMGPRRVGKTVMVYQSVVELLRLGIISNNVMYVSIDTPIYSGIGLEQFLRLFIKLHKHSLEERLYLFFDEIQYMKDWENHLKSLVDSYPNCRIVVTGSSAAALRLKSRESGAGRFTDFMLPALTFAEYLDFTGNDGLIQCEVQTNGKNSYSCQDIDKLNVEFLKYLNMGGYPETVIQGMQDQTRFIKSDIIDKVLLRDLPSLYGISDIQELNRLFNTLAYNTGNEVSLEGLSRQSGVSKNTIKRYVEYLEAAFLIKRVHRIDQNARHFDRATYFKVYLTNPSMRGALFGDMREDSQAMGALTETAIFSQWQHSTFIDNLFYSRWKEGEVDIVALNLSTQKPEWVVEVKWSDRPADDPREIRPIIQFCKTHSLSDTLVTSKTAQKSSVIDGVEVGSCNRFGCNFLCGVGWLAA